jgi:hypothetical protein
VLTADDANGEDDRGNATGSECAEQVPSSLHDAQADPYENHGDAPYAKDQTRVNDSLYLYECFVFFPVQTIDETGQDRAGTCL